MPTTSIVYEHDAEPEEHPFHGYLKAVDADGTILAMAEVDTFTGRLRFWKQLGRLWTLDESAAWIEMLDKDHAERLVAERAS